mmetsp:Transcript_100747/g.260285  ORF Transcript_100747/g.260285 Transcript_100747/m.260285 type:complete len:446 (+) Transcript_100747:65-1402(+)
MVWPVCSRTLVARATANALPRRIGGALQQQRKLSSQTLEVVKATLPAVAQAGPAFTAHFYKRMFAAHPELLNTFNVANQRDGKQQKALFSAVAASATSVLDTGALPLELLEGINQKHVALNVVPGQYDVVGEHLLGTITDLLNPPQEVLDAWGELYGALAKHCIEREEALYKEVESKPGGWRGMRKFVVKEKEVQSKVITKFTFAPTDGLPVCEALPGQYLTVWTYPGGERRQPRHYSIIPSSDEGTYSIAVKKEEKGLVSSFLHDRTAVGDEFDLSPPYGNFRMPGAGELWTKDADAPVVLLSAGVGITPMLAMLGTLKNGVQANEKPVLWLHGANNGREHAFRDYIVGLARAHPADLTRRVWYADPLPSDIVGGANNSPFHFTGMMDLNQVKDLLPLNKSNALYYFCGPVPWMRSIAHQLIGFGVDKSALNFEVFGPANEILG